MVKFPCALVGHKWKGADMYLDGKEILITGGTGTLGKALIKYIINIAAPKGIRVYSRDEYKQWLLKKDMKDSHVPISYILGDIRDYDALERAMKGVDYVFNTAAMKQVPACEDNPFEAKKTNIDGVENVARAAIENKVNTVMHISTDKAVYPVNFYGMTKAVGEKLILYSSTYCAGRTKFAVCRYGNVFGSRGSIIPLFKEQAKSGVITVTHKDMTRFWIEIDDVVKFIVYRVEDVEGGEVFIPKLKSAYISKIAELVAPKCTIKYIGVRKGEKLHECLISEEESAHALSFSWGWLLTERLKFGNSFSYTSLNNKEWLTDAEIKELIKKWEEKYEL